MNSKTNQATRQRLEMLGSKVGDDLQRTARKQVWVDGLFRWIFLFTLVPALVLVIQLVRYLAGESAAFLPVPWVVVAALLLPAVAALLWTLQKRQTALATRAALLAVDTKLGLADRLTSAQDFLEREVPGGFAAAAIEDGEARLQEVERTSIDWDSVAWSGRAQASTWVIAGVTLLLLVAQVALWTHTQTQEQDRVAWQSEAGVPIDPEEAQNPLMPEPNPEPETESQTPELSNPMGSSAEAKPSKPSPDLSDEVKESSGKSGEGKSAGAQSTSAASQSRSSPSNQGQSSKPEKPSKKKPKKKDRKANPEAEQPEKKPEQEEDAGSTAGRGSSKGSNKNPTSSAWKSKDQVTNEDDQEIEDDEEAEDDDEEQENRGGVQPHMRDRRPPVSRDLGIGFGNRSSPDANGRGGPSEQKKSRGVASLVLGVPIPDRIKGKPGPGPTKVTQERVEPQAESPDPIAAAPRAKRSSPLGSLSPLDLHPAMRQVVTDYFLSRRKVVQKP